MNIKHLIGLVLLLMLAACQGADPSNKRAENTEPTAWKFNFFSPKALPAAVTFAVIIDANQRVSRFVTLNSTPDLSDVVGEWNDYTRAPSGYWNHVKHPPKQLFFCWDSIIDKKVYETRLTISDADVEKMHRPSGHKNYLGQTAYYDNIQFGLAPEGKVAVWLVGTGDQPNYRLTPTVLNTVSGDELILCKGVTQSDFSYEYDQDIKDFIKGKKYPYGKW